MNPEDQIMQLARRVRSVAIRLPLIVGNEAVNFTLDNFKRQGFLGNSFQPWAKRKQGWKKDRRPNRAILIDRGRLRRSIRIVRLSHDSVTIGSDVPYAKAHNEGLRIGVIQTVKPFARRNGVNVKGHTRRINMKMPRRQFMGNSPYLNTRLRRVVALEYMKVLPLKH